MSSWEDVQRQIIAENPHLLKLFQNLKYANSENLLSKTSMLGLSLLFPTSRPAGEFFTASIFGYHD